MALSKHVLTCRKEIADTDQRDLLIASMKSTDLMWQHKIRLEEHEFSRSLE